MSGRKTDTHGAATLTKEKASQAPAAPVDIDTAPIPVAPKLRLLSLAAEGSAEQNPVEAAAVSNTEEPAPTILPPNPMLEVKIHLDQPVSAAPTPDAPNEDSEDTDPGSRRTLRTADVQQALPVVSVNIPQQTPPAGQTQLAAQNPTTVPASPVPVPPPVYAGQTKPEPQAASASPPEEPVADQTKTQPPIRSLALEFAPDGAGDVKVRLSERAGDVHISLHGTDPSLAGRVREGVSDLVGSLSKAGYDAEAWTPGEGRQGQRQHSDPRPSLRKTPAGANAAEFDGIFQQPIQEIS